MSEWWQSVLRFTRDGETVSVATPWYRETFLPASVVDRGDLGLFFTVDTDLLGDSTARFAVVNGYAQYRVEDRLPELWDTHHVYGFKHPVYRLRLSKARKF